MERCICPKCRRPFLYDPKAIPLRKSNDGKLGRTLYFKIMSCPYCDMAVVFNSYYEEWD